MLKLAAVLSLLVASAMGYSGYKALIPNGDSVPNPCGDGTWPGVGHWLIYGTGERNPFGEDFKANGYTWNAALCFKDSDGDGKTNGEELGDYACDWLSEYPIQLDPAIGHPGICEPVDSPACIAKQPDFNC
ncbi:MOXD1 homolog 1-like isoform X3 [Elysia marginata]|uniref:MOXD1 homolog 1-like isoform X3 n=1 Tax=Elysia marginata TaxID=1093978 RepID=A0AAV4JGH1_9GAST|nr:MOXD1 homolog 1-like isoform X3 [Elysia marginata]